MKFCLWIRKFYNNLNKNNLIFSQIKEEANEFKKNNVFEKVFVDLERIHNHRET